MDLCGAVLHAQGPPRNPFTTQIDSLMTMNAITRIANGTKVTMTTSSTYPDFGDRYYNGDEA
jgi:hypothetical protein